MSNDHDYDTERNWAEEEDYLYQCRKARTYDGPLGGPPGLRDEDRLKRFLDKWSHHVAEQLGNKVPLDDTNADEDEYTKCYVCGMDLPNDEEYILDCSEDSAFPPLYNSGEPFIRGHIASENAIEFMETEFYEPYWDAQEERDDDDDIEKDWGEINNN